MACWQVISLGALDSLARRQRSKQPVDIFGGILQAVPEAAVPHVTSVLARLHADPSFQGVACVQLDLALMCAIASAVTPVAADLPLLLLLLLKNM